MKKSSSGSNPQHSFKDHDLREIREIHSEIDPIFLRWSPRAFSGTPIADDTFKSIVEAGRQAPSSGNSQPWHLIYGHRNTPDWDPLFNLLVEVNQDWAKNAAVLMLFVTHTETSSGRKLGTASFDCGAFWMSLALEGYRQGLPFHGMAGFDNKKAREVFKLSNLFQVEAMACVGVPGDLSQLNEKNQNREIPSGRVALSDILHKTNKASEILALNMR